MSHIPNLEDIPEALRTRDQWVCWRYEVPEGGIDPTKAPYQARWPKSYASSTAERTWCSAEFAIAAAHEHGFDGIGFVFSPDDPLAGFDLDDIIDDQGRIADWAKPWIADLPTYIEVSPSGHGIKGFAIGKLPGDGINAKSVELYDKARFFTVTGKRLEGFPAEPQPVNGALDRLYAFALERKKILEAEREAKRKKSYALKALAKEVDKVESAPDGMRNDTLNSAAFSLAQFMSEGLLTEDQITDALTAAAEAAGLAGREIRSTIRSGIKAGSQEVRKIPDSKQGSPAAAVQGEVVSTKAAPPAKQVKPTAELTPMTGTELLASNDPPPRVFVPSLIRAGLSFFIGQPGVGKTPALVQLAIAYATGGVWLGVFKVPKIRVAYIGPEYDRGDIKSIVEASIGKGADLSNLLIFTVENFTGPANEEEAMQLVDMLHFKYGCEAIVIDLFTGFLPPEKFKQNAYRGDYREFLAYHRQALMHQMAITGAWHGTKRDANPATMYNGGQGFWGAAGGGRLVMFQDEEDQVKLYGQLRGNKAITYTMVETKASGRHFWAVIEGVDPEPAFNSDVHRAIWRILKQHAGQTTPIVPSAIAAILKSEHPEVTAGINYVRRALSVLLKRHIIHQIGAGYVLPKGDNRDNDDQGVDDDRGVNDVNDVNSPDVVSDLDNSSSDAIIAIIPDHPSMIAPAGQQDAPNEGPIIVDTVFLRSSIPIIPIDDVPGDDMTDSMPDEWQATPDDIVIAHDPSIAKRPWLVIVKPTGRRLAAEPTQGAAEESARMHRGA